SRQAEAVNTAGNTLRQAAKTWASTGAGVGSSQIYVGESSIPTYGEGLAFFGGKETRPVNAAYSPRIHA
ncbi:hypothetical protein ACLRAJ_17690, partial [Bordetella avium]